jgi:hypothetical protein
MSSSQIVNLMMMFVVCLMLGAIGGYWVADLRQPAAPNPVGRIPGGGATLITDVLPLEQAWIVEGLTCPHPNCTNTLRDCEHATARQIRAQVNSQLATGRSGEAITAQIISRHGKAVFKFGEELTR